MVKKRKPTKRKILKPNKVRAAKAMKPTLTVIALGGNALIRKGQRGTDTEQMKNLVPVCASITRLMKKGHHVVLTHGNGPQVGSILLQQEAGERVTPKMRLDVCGAESQGEIGYFIQQVLQNEMRKQGIGKKVVTLITRTIVDAHDPAFRNPTKPIGPFYEEGKATALAQELGWRVVSDSGRGWRRVVPSPEPKEIVELPEVRKLLEMDCIIICCGGGGIPVIHHKTGEMEGIEAVIDKDLAAELLASRIGAERLIIVTDVKKVALDYGTENQRNIDSMTVKEAKTRLGEGHFAHGSMGPKIEASIRFAQSGKGRKAIIAHLDELESAINGKTGTTISL